MFDDNKDAENFKGLNNSRETTPTAELLRYTNGWKPVERSPITFVKMILLIGCTAIVKCQMAEEEIVSVVM